LIGWAGGCIGMDEYLALCCVIAGSCLGLLTFFDLRRSAARASKVAALFGLCGTLAMMFIGPLLAETGSVLLLLVTGVCLCLLLACLTRWLRWRVFVASLIVWAGLLAVLEVGAFPPKKLMIVVPGPASPAETYRGYILEEAKARRIAEVYGTFSLDTRISAELFSVRAGVIEPVAYRECWRSPDRSPSPIWEDLRVTLALSNEEGPDGNWTTLCTKGETRGYGSISGIRNDIRIVDSRLLRGYLGPGNRFMLYAEGDEKLVIERGMTVEEFAQKNKGSYLVVTIARN